MKINFCFPNDGSKRAFHMDFTYPINVAISWERIVCDSEALYEKEIASLVGLNLLCASIRNFKHFRSFDECERLYISSVLKLFCRYVKNFVYIKDLEEVSKNGRNS